MSLKIQIFSISGGKSQGHAILYKKSLFDLNDSGYINLGPHDKWGQRSVEYALLTHKATEKKIDHFNTHFCVCTDTISDCCGQEGQYQSAKEVQAAMDLHRRPGLFALARLETLKSLGTLENIKEQGAPK